jgi:hypothetical protein
MKKLTIFFIIFAALSISLRAQSQPFEKFTQAVREEKGGFAGNKELLTTIFNQERIRIGADFETELWKYLDDEVEKHYWIGIFLESSGLSARKHSFA